MFIITAIKNLLSEETKKRLIAFIGIISRYRIGWLMAIGAGVLSVAMKLPVPFLTGYIIDSVIRSGNGVLLDRISIIILGATIIFIWLSYICDYLTFRIHRASVIRLQLMLIKHIQHLPSSWIADKEIGYVMSRIQQDPSSVTEILMQIIRLAYSVLMLIIGIIAVFVVNARLAALCMILIPCFAASYMVFQKRIRSADSNEKEQSAEVSRELSRLLSINTECKMLQIDSWAAKKYAKQMRNLLTLATKSFNINYIVNIFVTFCAALGPLIVIWYGGHLIIRGELTIGQLVCFSSLLGYLFNPTSSIVNANVSVIKAFVSLNRVYDLLSLPTEEIISGPIHREGTVKDYGIEMRSVRFGYSDDRDIIHNMNLTIASGESIGLVGHTGAGKSTLIRLIPLLLSPNEGEIVIGGCNTKDLGIRKLRSLIGMMPQEPVMFNGSIYQNILAGKLSASRDEVMDATIRANALGIIESLPQGFDTEVGDKGYCLSCGQREIIAIARIILRGSPILILDEPTASMDSETETLIMESLQEFMRTRTTIVVSHRFSTILPVDRVVVLDQGQVLDTGTHEELFDRCSVYSSILSCAQKYSLKGEKDGGADDFSHSILSPA